MTFESSIDRLTAALEAFTGILATQTLKSPAAAQTPVTTETPKTNGSAAPAEPPKRGRGRPPVVKKPEAEEPLGADDEFGDDDGLGGDDTPSVTPEEARTAVIAYRDAAVKLGGDKDAAMAQTRALLKPICAKLDAIDDSNAAAVIAAFAAATKKLGK